MGRSIGLLLVEMSAAALPLTFGILCSDGFRHEISSEEIASQFDPHLLMDNNTMSQRAAELIEENKRRGERDNISVALVRTF